MINAHTAIRAWVELKKRQRKRKPEPPAFRPQRYGYRALVLDLETTTSHDQRLLFGFFRLYEADRLILEGIVAADMLSYEAMESITEYAARRRLAIYSRERFVEEIFYTEVYGLGTLCVGFNLPFDLTRLAIKARCGNGKNRRKFTIVLSRRLRWHDLRIEAASGHAAFIGFTPKHKLSKWEKPFFKGRFLDLSTLTRAFTGTSLTLKKACKNFRTHTRKMEVKELGNVDRRTLTYGRQDVRVTWALYRKLRDEYGKHPFASFENERSKSELGLHMGAIYSSATIAKQYLRLLGFRPLLEAQPTFNRSHLGKGAASYFGGRAEVKVRRAQPLVKVLDFTSMYPTIFILQNLQALVAGGMLPVRCRAAQIQAFVNGITTKMLFDPETWKQLNCLVEVEPNGTILPVRMRRSEEDPYTIAVTPLESPERRWYTLADVAAAKLLGGKAPTVKRAIRFVPLGKPQTSETSFAGKVPLRSDEQINKTIVEQRQVAKDSGDKHLQMGLKQMAASGTYGIFAEINVNPRKPKDSLPGTIYSDSTRDCPNVPDERAGGFANPIIASLVTGGARLMLALLESEVQSRSGTFVFCDTDSLAIVCQEEGSAIPGIPPADIDEIVGRFDALNPYENIPHLLKIEYGNPPDLRCFAVSAKRYVLYRVRNGNRIQIVKASESGLGAIMGRKTNENSGTLARRIWLSILMDALPLVNQNQRRRVRVLTQLDIPLRRKFPISSPAVYKRLKQLNDRLTFDYGAKPYGFVQTLTPVLQSNDRDILPILPFEIDESKTRRLPCIDFHSGKEISIDWNGQGFAGTVPVIRLNSFIDQYAHHPESKAAGPDGEPCDEDTVGLLQRLPVRSISLTRIGKEVDRLDTESGATLDAAEPKAFEDVDQQLAAALEILAPLNRSQTAQRLWISERRWRDIVKQRANPRDALRTRILKLAASENGSTAPANRKQSGASYVNKARSARK